MTDNNLATLNWKSSSEPLNMCIMYIALAET